VTQDPIQPLLAVDRLTVTVPGDPAAGSKEGPPVGVVRGVSFAVDRGEMVGASRSRASAGCSAW
jgi:ABC-type glutathione transport system ATPase component